MQKTGWNFPSCFYHSALKLLFSRVLELFPQFFHERLLFAGQIMQRDKAVAVFIKSRLRPISRACQQSVFIDPEEFVVHELHPFAGKNRDSLFMHLLNPLGARSKSAMHIDDKSDIDPSFMGGDDLFDEGRVGVGK